MLRENGKVTYYLFTAKDATVFWAHIKVPSEVVHNFYYDVVFKFIPTQASGYTDDLFKYNVQFFSNDPNFVYTFAYVFHKNNLLVEELRSRLPKECITKAPEEKNPTEQISYEKAIYFAYLIMKERRLNHMLRFKAEAKPLDSKFLLQNIELAEDKIKSREEEGKKYSSKKKAVISQNAAKQLSKVIGSKDVDLSRSNVRVATMTKKVPITKANKNSHIKRTPKK